MKTTALQQGNADGLCGLYAIMNFLYTTHLWKEDEHPHTLWYLLDAARHFGWLNPYTLTQGFEDFRLKAILDLQIENFRMSYSSYFMTDVVRIKQATSVFQIATDVAAVGGSIIASNNRREHWVLLTPDQKDIFIIDSANGDAPVKTFERRHRSLSREFGVVIVPSERRAVELEF